MPSSQHVSDVTDLAKVLLGEYREGTPFHDLPRLATAEDDPSDVTFVIEVDAAGSTLRGLLAALGTVELAVDAATVAVAYDLEISQRSGQDWNAAFLESLAREPLISMELVELANGSFRVKLKAHIRNPVARAVVIAIATVSTVALAVVNPLIAAPSAIVGAVVTIIDIGAKIQEKNESLRQLKMITELNEELADQKKARAYQQSEINRLNMELSEALEAGAKIEQDMEELKSQVKVLQSQYAASHRPVARDDLDEAQITRIDVRLESSSEAA